MSDGSFVQGKIYRGYGIAGKHLGTKCQVYRPTSALISATDASALSLSGFYASFNNEDMEYSKPNRYGDAVWWCVADGTKLKPGDYIVTGGGARYFISAMQLLLPILAVECNRTISIRRPQQEQGVGAQGYGGDTLAVETLLMTGFPASVLQGTKGDRSQVNLPGDVRNPWWAILLPNLPGNVYLRNEDIVTDDLGRRYVISSAEQTDLGWRMSAMQAET